MRDIPWTKPEDIPYDPQRVLPELGSKTTNGFDTLFADGSVRFIIKTVDPSVLRALITKDGGEVISQDAYATAGDRTACSDPASSRRLNDSPVQS